MLNLLTSSTFWIALIVLGVVIALFIIAGKFPKTKKPILIVCSVIALVSAIYSLYQIKYYYTTKGAIFGTYSSTDDDNQLYADQLSFNFKNVEMTATGNGEEYSVTFLSEEKINLDSDVNYLIYVNGMPCDYIEISDARDYLIATYQYNYYNEAKECTMNDTLTIKLTTYENGATFVVKTQGGAEAVKYWNNYFNKNNFIVTIEEANVIYTPDISYGEGVVLYFTATFYVGDEIYLSQVYTPNETVIFPTYDDFRFSGWALSEDADVVPSYTITENVNFYAKLDRTYTDEEYLIMALNEMENGVLDLSPYPISAIPDGYFQGNASIFEIKMSNTVQTIGNDAFNAPNVTKITLGAGVKCVGEYCCTSNTLKTLVLNEGLETIGVYAFSGAGIKTLTIPGTVTSIGDYAFRDCNSLASVTVEEGVTKLSFEMFSFCNNLEYVKLPTTLTMISSRCFEDCFELTSIYIPVSVAVIGADAFSDVADGFAVYTGCSSIPSGWYDAKAKATTNLGYTYTEYLNALNGESDDDSSSGSSSGNGPVNDDEADRGGA